MTISTLPTYMLDTTTMLRHWRIQRAVAVMQEARRQADAEVATIAHLPTIEMPTRQLQRLVDMQDFAEVCVLAPLVEDSSGGTWDALRHLPRSLEATCIG